MKLSQLFILHLEINLPGRPALENICIINYLKCSIVPSVVMLARSFVIQKFHWCILLAIIYVFQ